MSTQREVLAQALEGHRYDTMSQDSGMQCLCGSDSRFEQRGGDLPWATYTEHLADVALRAIAVASPPRVPEPEEGSLEARMLDSGASNWEIELARSQGRFDA